MNLVKSLLEFIQKKDTAEEIKAPQGVCPNCWGKEEYAGHFYSVIKQNNFDVNNKNSDIGWINDYANKNLAGIALKKRGNGEDIVCEKCKISYQHSDEHTT